MQQKKYYKNFNFKINLCTEIEFKETKNARNTKSKTLKSIPEQQKESCTAATKKIVTMSQSQDEKKPTEEDMCV